MENQKIHMVVHIAMSENLHKNKNTFSPSLCISIWLYGTTYLQRFIIVRLLVLLRVCLYLLRNGIIVLALKPQKIRFNSLKQSYAKYVNTNQQQSWGINERRHGSDQYNLTELTMRKEPHRIFWFLFCRSVIELELAKTNLRNVHLKSRVTVRNKIRHICLHSKNRI